MKTNPNKVNQYTAPDPRQALFLEYYLDRDSDTFAEVRKSGKKAGFTDEYSKTLMSKMPKWLSNVVRDEDLVNMAENNLKEFLSPEEEDKKIRADMTKFTLKGLKKEKYSERTEHTGKNGESIQVNIVNYADTNTIQVPTKKVPDTNIQRDGQGNKKDNPSMA